MRSIIAVQTNPQQTFIAFKSWGILVNLVYRQADPGANYRGWGAGGTEPVIDASPVLLNNIT